MAVLTLLPDRTVRVEATGEEARLVLAGHAVRALRVPSATHGAHPAPAVRLFGAARSARAVSVGSAGAARRSETRGSIEPASRVREAGRRVVVAAAGRKQ